MIRFYLNLIGFYNYYKDDNYVLDDYIIESKIDDEGFTILEVKDYDNDIVAEYSGISLPDENDFNSIILFEDTITSLLKGDKLI